MSLSDRISKAYLGAVGEKCRVTFFKFHIRLFPGTFSTFAVFCRSVVNGVGVVCQRECIRVTMRFLLEGVYPAPVGKL